jgi:hypothetical protein
MRIDATLYNKLIREQELTESESARLDQALADTEALRQPLSRLETPDAEIHHAEIKAAVLKRLAPEPGERAARTVGLLPDDSPSLAWRSQLNEKLVQEQESRPQPRRVIWWLGGAVATAAAAAFFMMILSNPVTDAGPVASEDTLERGLVDAHQEAVSLTSLEIGTPYESEAL